MHTRADFLAAGALAALIPSLGTAAQAQDAALAATPPPADAIPPLSFDLAAFDAATGKPASHRPMFASTKLAGGTVLDAVKSTLDAFALLKEPLASVSSAVVLYHGASIMLAFDDGVWQELLLPAFPKLPPHIRDDVADYKDAHGNPFHKPAKPDQVSVDGLAKSGTLFFVCNNATEGFAHLLAGITKSSQLKVYRQLVAGLVQNASLVPAGVWAVHALQERRYTYLQTTL